MIFEKQDYQQSCIDNITSLLANFDFTTHNPQELKACLQNFYKHNVMPVTTLSEKLNVDILMETGTGKTFTYLNLIFELNKHFKQNKFIIFVPRKAILESVKQNIKLTKDYFYSEYQQYLRVYDSTSKSAITNHYVQNQDELSVLILTNSAIDKQSNILNKTNENANPQQLFQVPKSVFENIAALKPISIIDEPHLLKGEAFHRYFSKLNSLYFRFGATFPKEGKKPNDKEFALSNMIYCLDSISAFRAYLVKQVKVHTIKSSSTQIFLKSYKDKKAIFSYTQSGIEKEQELRLNESFSQLNGATLLKVEKDKAYFSNQSILDKKGESYHLDEDELTALLGKAIDLHFEKEQRLFAKGIKALSLFFISNIADFRGEKPFIKSTFEELYKAKREELLKKDLDENYRAYLAQDFDESGNLQVHQGYFSGDKGSKDDKEAAGVKMILEEKEKLLSLNTPLRFIFSVWALQEGWDNPNIFTLTKLASSSSDISIHQQVGRGLRLCVNDKGKRITHRFMDFDDDSFYRLNYLDIIVSAKESNYIGNLQKEIEDSSYILSDKILSKEELSDLLNGEQDLIDDFMYILRKDLELIAYDKEKKAYIIQAPIYESIKDDDKIKELLGESFDKVLEFFKAKESQSTNKHNQVENGDKKPDQVTIRPNLAKDFKELWEKINQKAKITYQDIKEQDIIDQAAKEFNKTNIEKESYTYERKRYDAQQNIIITEDSITLGDIDYQVSFAKDMQNLLLDFSKEAKLPLRFLLQIYAKCDKEKFKNSPKKAFTTLKNIIKDQIHHNLLQCISYDFSTAKNESESIFSSGTLPRHTLGRYYESGKPADNYLYEEIVYDSKIERTIIKEDNEKVDSKTIKVFAKLPKLIIPTPYKHYEPDFAYFLEDSNGKKIFFVCESKGYDDENEISKNEMQKIKYAEKFFTQLSQKLENDNIQIIFKKRINKQTLLECLRQTQGENNAN
ncbi:DEAD/DEAH box helicase family protein [Campylobacter upsaliensis]|uniref:restriction endonuclease n=1 Tax=Campylobacter upsaliensis TaxID=28080 RepID=UPI0022EB7FDF|nr:DEAD/DEAH box helicase family protein [Campylobacter upsaliensis]ELS3707869.1 DEAD/DEAH box helicase family protein [Campylobacter upsaliensis]